MATKKMPKFIKDKIDGADEDDDDEDEGTTAKKDGDEKGKGGKLKAWAAKMAAAKK